VVRSLVPLVNGGFAARPVLVFFLYDGRPVVTGLTLLDHRSAIPIPISVLRRLTNAYTTSDGTSADPNANIVGQSRHRDGANHGRS
jgi:hypothetical protein